MNRDIEKYIKKDLPHKIVLLMGPRQCGKTTLAKQLNPEYDYFNYDLAEDRLALQRKSWDRRKPLIIYDELHKMKAWKRWLKGIYDTEGIPPQLLVTGSAQLNTYRKVGDSLAGRYFSYHLHPLDLKELLHFSGEKDLNKIFENFWYCGGFPEPYFNGSQTYYNRWRRTHLDIILRQDLLDLYAVRDIAAIETLVSLLKQRVGSSVSYANLARDLERDANTIKHWLQLLENLYVIYRVTPYHKNVARALLKEPKYYFFDHAQVEDNGARLETIVANALRKHLDFLEDTTGVRTSLHYLRTKDHKEIDFLTVIENRATHMIEVKMSDDAPAAGFKHFQQYFPKINKIQLVKELAREKSYPDGLVIHSLTKWLSDFSLS